MTAYDRAAHPAALPARPVRAVASGVDFLHPAGDPGLYGPDSMAWRIHANPISLAVGGVAAVILELAEPRVRTGVWEHSIFRTDPLSRMRRTGEATMITTYGPTAEAERRIAMVTRMHERVSGQTPEGQAYEATDPELMTWVHLTAGYGFLKAYVRYVDPTLSRADQDRYFAEGAKVGRMFGAGEPVTTLAEAEAVIEAMRPKLKPHPIIGEFLQIVTTTSPLGLAGRVLQPLVVEAAIDMLPPWAEGQLELPRNRLRRAAGGPALRSLAQVARLRLGDIPVQAYARVGRAPPK